SAFFVTMLEAPSVKPYQLIGPLDLAEPTSTDFRRFCPYAQKPMDQFQIMLMPQRFLDTPPLFQNTPSSLWLNRSRMSAWKRSFRCAGDAVAFSSPPSFTAGSMDFGTTARLAQNSSATSKIA